MKLAHLTATAMAVLVLTGCTDDPQPKVEPSGRRRFKQSTLPRPNEGSSPSSSLACSEACPAVTPRVPGAGESDAELQDAGRNLRDGFDDGGRIVGGWKVVKIRLTAARCGPLVRGRAITRNVG